MPVCKHTDTTGISGCTHEYKDTEVRVKSGHMNLAGLAIKKSTTKEHGADRGEGKRKEE